MRLFLGFARFLKILFLCLTTKVLWEADPTRLPTHSQHINQMVTWPSRCCDQ
uniref:Uncharacterized protein n=1 Tax=Anguilla anguilla TaxID=7936 RepID=A0A0E9SFE9_ANGAN